MQIHMLTTIDNPYDPFTHYDEWYAFDTISGYNSAAFLARVVEVSDELSESETAHLIEQAIDEIVRENVNGMFIKVSKEI